MAAFETVRSIFSKKSPALAAFDHLIKQAKTAGYVLVPRVGGRVRSIEIQWAHRRRNPFSIQAQPNHINFYLRGPILSAHKDLFAAATRRFGKVDANSLEEYRTHIRTVREADAMLAFLREHGAWETQGRARYAATDQNLRDHALEPTMRWLIATALDGTTMTYGQIKRQLEQQASFSTVFATRIGMVAGALMHRIQDVVPDAPLINVLVVNQQDWLPSKGAGSFLAVRFRNPRLANPEYKHKHPARWKSYFERAAAEVYAYSPAEWAALFERVFGKKLSKAQIADERDKRQDGDEDDFGAGAGKYGAGGEGEHHKALRLWVTANPDKVRGSFAKARTETEFQLDSGDRVDTVYHLGDRTIVLEVKSRISNEIDLRRGVYQCIKYRAVKEAMDVRDDVPVEAYLVTETEPPGEITGLLRQHGIHHFQAPMKRG